MADAIGGYKNFSSRAFNFNCYKRYAHGLCVHRNRIQEAICADSGSKRKSKDIQ